MANKEVQRSRHPAVRCPKCNACAPLILKVMDPSKKGDGDAVQLFRCLGCDHLIWADEVDPSALL